MVTEATNLSSRRLPATTSFSYSPNPISDSPFFFIHFCLQLRHTHTHASLNAGLSLLSFTLLLSIRRKFTLETSSFLLNHHHHQRNMVSPETTNWLFDYALIDDIPVPDDANFSAPTAGFSWSMQPFNGSSDVSAEIEGSLLESDGLKEPGSKKRVRTESSCASSSKACREKLRRDRLNDKFLELGATLEPGRAPKTDKAAILIDAVRMVTQLRGEAQMLKDSNTSLLEKIKDLKAEKNELRDEKQRLKLEKEKLEQQLKAMNSQPGFLPPAVPATFAAQGQAPGNKLVPFVGYPGVAMWQFMPPAAVDTSQDHVLRPPVA